MGKKKKFASAFMFSIVVFIFLLFLVTLLLLFGLYADFIVVMVRVNQIQFYSRQQSVLIFFLLFFCLYFARAVLYFFLSCQSHESRRVCYDFSSSFETCEIEYQATHSHQTADTETTVNSTHVHIVHRA